MCWIFTALMTLDPGIQYLHHTSCQRLSFLLPFDIGMCPVHHDHRFGPQVDDGLHIQLLQLFTFVKVFLRGIRAVHSSKAWVSFRLWVFYIPDLDIDSVPYNKAWASCSMQVCFCPPTLIPMYILIYPSRFLQMRSRKCCTVCSLSMSFFWFMPIVKQPMRS